ncbi:MAG: carboxymuconolactone decarboxylase family protein [Hyphomonadaceae bacterium]|jgi:AhpD family alkylhydroperoxidase|nr:carboxymuconolactone decarboxylase family protein [Hyphomonadaceae bacterium]
MHQRLDYKKASPTTYEAMLALKATVEKSGLEKSLIELIQIRASQINKCAFCLYMHTRAARLAGISDEQIFLLDAWRESSLYSERERAALAWTEALTLLPEQGAPEDGYQAMVAQFSEAEIASVTLAIVLINGWNRISVGFNVQHPTKPKLVEA